MNGRQIARRAVRSSRIAQVEADKRAGKGDHGLARDSHDMMPGIIDEWVTGVSLMRSEYGTHSLRRTKASIIYRATGNLRAVEILLDHGKIEIRSAI